MSIEMLRMCKRIGIDTFGELKRFFKEERRAGESAGNCLMRYYLEIGGTSFKIKHS